ncbi:MAG: FAD-dependent oxidoreductase, partial [Prochlorothrix sp.]
VVILGAGPGGLLLANRLAHRSPHYQITIYEKRPDPRQVSSGDRAFALGLMKRGREALQTIPGLWEAVVSQGVEVNRSGFYSAKKQQWQMLDRNYPPGEAMVLIQRDRLCRVLLEQLAQIDPQGDRVRVIFQARAHRVDLHQHQVSIQVGAEDAWAEPGEGAEIEQGYDLLVGADGINSSLRQAFLPRSGFDFEQSYFTAVWKVLPLEPLANFAGGTSYFARHALPPEAGADRPNTLIGAILPTAADRHCLLLFWDQLSDQSRDNPPTVTTPADWPTQIAQWFPGLEITPDQGQQLWAMQPSSIVSSQCSRYHDLPGQAVLLGDAAHGMSSRLGQGCQAAFGDVLVLDELLGAEGDRLDRVLPQYSDRQVPEGHAITSLNRDLSPKAKWVATLYGLSSLIHGKLYDAFPQWLQPPLFKAIGQTTIPYRELARRNQFWIWLTQVTDP